MRSLLRYLALVLAASLAPFGVDMRASPQPSSQQQIVDRARATVENLRNDPDLELGPMLERAKAVLIFPSLIKAGFILGGEAGNGVLLVRHEDGEWSYPAFYTITSGSVGLQIGAQDAEVIFTIMTEQGLDQVLKTQFKLGADASIAVGPKGVGLEAATTAALGADIYSFAKAKGAYGGGSFEGSYFHVREEWNRLYYGQPVSVREIVIDRVVSNPDADALRQALAAR